MYSGGATSPRGEAEGSLWPTLRRASSGGGRASGDSTLSFGTPVLSMGSRC